MYFDIDTIPSRVPLSIFNQMTLNNKPSYSSEQFSADRRGADNALA